MSKLANPWKCDASGCGMLRANDTNHWLTVALLRDADRGNVSYVVIAPWSDAHAEQPGTKHACGIECGLKTAAQLMVENFFPNDSSSTGKEVASG
jgi:hypothetical protein